jgi:hypothetical protein
MTTTLHVPAIELVESRDTIASCNACGVQNYVVGIRGEEPYRPTGLKLWDLRVTPNGVQTTVTKLCGHCVVTMRDVLGAVAEQWTGPRRTEVQ